MKKTATLFGCVCLCALFSCKKDLVTPVTDLATVSQKNLSLTTVNGQTVNTDTIPPTNAVDVHTLGVKGDGVTDDTKALQAAFNSHSVLLLKGGKYIINTTITMPAGLKLYGTGGATITAGNSMSGTLSTLGRYLFINNSNRNVINNVTFTKSSEAFNLGVWGTSVIYIENSPYVNVSYCKFNFNQPYQHSGVKAVWCEGTGTLYTYIWHNTCNTVGIEYAEAGASGTSVMYNTINNANSNALSGDGDNPSYCTGIQVCYNTINQAGYNGVNDWGTIDGTLIRGNVINGTGKSPSEGALGEGIQCAAVNAVVTLNTISDAQAQYIEVGSPSTRVDSNKIIDTKLTMLGIVVECMVTPSSRCKTTTAEVGYNNITGCLNAVQVIGNVTPSVNIRYNTINNPKNIGVNIVSNSASYVVNLTGNIINMTTPSLQARNAILSYATPMTTTQLVNLTNNNITYGTGANGGAGTETAVSTHTNTVTLVSNKVTGNSVKSKSGVEVFGINSNGATYTGCKFTNNSFTNCLTSITGFKTVLNTGNTF
jgi:hypothetical protein